MTIYPAYGESTVDDQPMFHNSIHYNSLVTKVLKPTKNKESREILSKEQKMSNLHTNQDTIMEATKITEEDG
jgi:hypothetical protein